MKKHEWLNQDAITRAPIPFNLSQTRLQLLGFFISENQAYPAPVEMIAETAGQRYRVSHMGYAHKLDKRNDRDMREPDKTAVPGATIKLGHVAYAVNPDHILVGAGWEIRRDMRRLITAGHVPPSTALAMMDYLQQQPKQVLLARAYMQKGLEGYGNTKCWMDLRDKIRKVDVRRPVAKRVPEPA